MQVFSASQAKNEFGRLLDASQREPVTIEKQGREFAVLISSVEYKHLHDKLMELEDMVWTMAAEKAGQEGFAGVEESENFLKSLSDDED